eukprot:758728-Hanusia_phi.AAC.3
MYSHVSSLSVVCYGSSTLNCLFVHLRAQYHTPACSSLSSSHQVLVHPPHELRDELANLNRLLLHDLHVAVRGGEALEEMGMV